MNIVERLEQVCHDAGLELSHKGMGHYHVYNPENNVLVNYWPLSKRRTAHIRATQDGMTGCMPEDVVKFAKEGKYGYER